MSGASWANIRLRRRPRGWSPALEAAKIVSGLVLGCVGVCVFFWSRSRAFQGVYRICRALGKIRGCAGCCAVTTKRSMAVETRAATEKLRRGRRMRASL